jgi:hypothetical protein
MVVLVLASRFHGHQHSEPLPQYFSALPFAFAGEIAEVVFVDMRWKPLQLPPAIGTMDGDFVLLSRLRSTVKLINLKLRTGLNSILAKSPRNPTARGQT